ncbi:hypothetical protein H5410_040985 [Solanum commersonii]|uniref:Aminotransferase-like plant mobile domain-containing protein n=1 Tax=Solanum commersonii TaxID=4109 RepID=A0A9J5XSE0_SOLCO|nr:hypothetical protein H5410_040985 [Solanum commersonii]
MILAEIFRALGKCKRGEANFFEGCNFLLQMWAIEHFHHHKNMDDICFSNANHIDSFYDRMRRFVSPVGIDDRRFYYIELIRLKGLQPYAPVREDRNSMSLEGEQGFEDIGMTIWIRHSHLGTKVVTPEMWAQMETILQYLDNAGAGPSNVEASSSLPPPA